MAMSPHLPIPESALDVHHHAWQNCCSANLHKGNFLPLGFRAYERKAGSFWAPTLTRPWPSGSHRLAALRRSGQRGAADVGCGSGCPQGPQLNGAIYKPAVSLRERVHPTQSSFPNCCHCKLLASEEHTPETEKRRNFQQQARQAPPLEHSAWLAGPSPSPTFLAREWKGMPPAPSPPSGLWGWWPRSSTIPASWTWVNLRNSARLQLLNLDLQVRHLPGPYKPTKLGNPEHRNTALGLSFLICKILAVPAGGVPCSAQIRIK